MKYTLMGRGFTRRWNSQDERAMGDPECSAAIDHEHAASAYVVAGSPRITLAGR